MTLREYRERAGFTLRDMTSALGLSAGAAGWLSRIERGIDPFPIRLALEVEVWSGGELKAIDLLRPVDAALLRASIDRATSARLAEAGA